MSLQLEVAVKQPRFASHPASDLLYSPPDPSLHAAKTAPSKAAADRLAQVQAEAKTVADQLEGAKGQRARLQAEIPQDQAEPQTVKLHLLVLPVQLSTYNRRRGLYE